MSCFGWEELVCFPYAHVKQRVFSSELKHPGVKNLALDFGMDGVIKSLSESLFPKAFTINGMILREKHAFLEFVQRNHTSRRHFDANSRRKLRNRFHDRVDNYVLMKGRSVPLL
uniref:AlNc14C404G11402 protein n=1 Tax=Albugo laibachii Nc14 TaxID=890382 RepID=F0WYZ1_9STRA|nr:AlNc14C404G11402 [Albugo laibachii Nc14]|eukprot:CCA26705.1 AlNc14C404G11402 [Albugo laibachii Nc14]